MLSRAEGRKQRAELLKKLDADHRAQARAKLAGLRIAIREAKAHKKEAMRAAVANCRALRLAARARARDERQRAEALLKQAKHDERLAAEHACREGKRAAGAGLVGAIANLASERKDQRDLRRIERGNRTSIRERKRSTALERRAESDDEVRSNIPPDYVTLFNKVRRSIKGSTRESRTEAFLKYAEEHPREIYGAIEDGLDREIAELEARAWREERELKKGKKRGGGKGGGDVPF